MRIAIVANRNMSMSPEGATAVDLCVRDFIRFSRFAETTTAYVCPVSDPFADIAIAMVGDRERSWRSNAGAVADRITADGADLVVVHQHLPTAAEVACRVAPLPVLYHTHTFEKPAPGPLSRWNRSRRYRRLAGIIFVSDVCRTAFSADFPRIDRPLHVVDNGLDVDIWAPSAERDDEIFFAGRLARSKGVLDLAEALGPVLDGAPAWRAVFHLAEKDGDPDYRDAVLARLAGLGDRVDIRFQAPHAAVKARLERAAIAVVPSTFEPFGRTALEAMAGGAALVTTGIDGLNRVAGDAALRVKPGDAGDLAAALTRLIGDPELRRTLSAAGIARARSEFDIRRSAAKLDDIYAAVVGR